MDSSYATLALYALGATALGTSLFRLKTRLDLSAAKHPSLAGHARIARRLAELIPFYEYDEAQFFRSDDPTEEVALRRQAAFARLASLYRERFPKSAALSAQARESISDLQFTGAYRVPFQYSRMVRENLNAGSFVQSSA